MTEHTIAIPLSDEEYLKVNQLYDKHTEIDLQHPNKRNKTRPEFYRELLNKGIATLEEKTDE